MCPYMPNEERLRTQYRKVTACRSWPYDKGVKNLSTHAKESKARRRREWVQSCVIVSYDKFGSLGDVGVIV
jgi:hypothetical protein